MPRFPPEVVAAGMETVAEITQAIERSVMSIWADIEKRRKMFAAGEGGSRQVLAFERELAIEFEKQIAQIRKQFSSSMQTEAFWTRAESLAKLTIPRQGQAAFAKIISDGILYRTTKNLFIQKELLGAGQGLYSVAPAKIMNQVNNVVYDAVMQGKTTSELRRELTPLYRAARGDKKVLFERGGDLGDIGNSARAAVSETHAAMARSSISYGMSDPDVIGVRINYDGACEKCTAALGGDDGNGTFLFADVFMIPLPVHVQCDCYVEGYIYKGQEDTYKSGPMVKKQEKAAA